MSQEEYEDDCEGCKPAVFNAVTGEVFPDDSPPMQAILKIWAKTTLLERQAWHRVTCQNSRAPGDLEIVAPFIAAIKDAFKKSSGITGVMG